MPKRKGNKRGAKKFAGGAAPHRSLGAVSDGSSGSDSELPDTRNKKTKVAGRSTGPGRLVSTRKKGCGDATLDSECDDCEDEQLDYDRDISKLKPGAQWCCGCKDDPDLQKVMCAHCGQVVCYGPVGSKACLELVDSFLNETKDFPGNWSFQCPGCAMDRHTAVNKHGSGSLRYFGFVDGQGNTAKGIIKNIRNRELSFFRPIRLPTLGLVQIQLSDSPDDFEVPFKLTELLVSGYATGVVWAKEVLSGNLHAPEVSVAGGGSPKPIVKSKIKFDFLKKHGRERYEKDISSVMTAFDRMGVNEVVIFIVTHTDPDSGNLHFAPSNQGAEKLEIVLHELVPPSFRNWLLRHNSHLFLITCGSKLLTKSGYEYLHDWVFRQVLFGLGSCDAIVTRKHLRKYFNNIFCFPTPNLQPRRIAQFVAHYVERVIYELVAADWAILRILDEDSRMGLHTHVLRLSSSNGPGLAKVNARRYVWSQRYRRPYGYQTPTYCVVCHSVKCYDCEGMDASRSSLTWYCQGTLPAKDNSQTGYQAGCSESVTASLTWEEGELSRGGASIFGSWQSHKFEWGEDIIARF